MKNRNSRRKFVQDVIKGSTMATAAFIPSQSVLANTGIKTEEQTNDWHKFLTPPYLQNITPYSVDILFVTNNRAYSWVEYGEVETNKRGHATSDGYIVAYNRINNIRLDNLKPNTTYNYRVVSKEITQFKPYELKYGVQINSDTFSFSTPKVNEDECNCIIFNDIHERAHSFSELLQANGNRAFNFVILNGDMFDFEEDEAQVIRNLLNPCANLFAKSKPYVMLRGNHETRGKFRAELKNYFSYPTNEYYFTQVNGPVHFTFLDTGEDKPDDAEVYAGIVDFDAFREKQALWLEKEMQKPEYINAKYKVIVMHIPPYYSGDWHGTLHCRKVFSPLFEKYKVDLVLAGHTHTYGVHMPNKEHNYPIIIGGGPKNGKRTVINLNANQENLKITMIADNGKQVGEYLIVH